MCSLTGSFPALNLPSDRQEDENFNTSFSLKIPLLPARYCSSSKAWDVLFAFDASFVQKRYKTERRVLLLPTGGLPFLFTYLQLLWSFEGSLT